MRAMTVEAGLQVSDVNYVKAGAGDTFIAAMKQGQIDVGITTQPTVLALETGGTGQLLVDLSKPDTTEAALGGPYPFISLWARADWIAANNDTVQHVVNAYVKTLKWIQTHTAADIAAKLPADYSAADLPGYIQALTDSYGMFNPTGQFAARLDRIRPEDQPDVQGQPDEHRPVQDLRQRVRGRGQPVARSKQLATGRVIGPARSLHLTRDHEADRRTYPAHRLRSRARVGVCSGLRSRQPRLRRPRRRAPR